MILYVPNSRILALGHLRFSPMDVVVVDDLFDPLYSTSNDLLVINSAILPQEVFQYIRRHDGVAFHTVSQILATTFPSKCSSIFFLSSISKIGLDEGAVLHQLFDERIQFVFYIKIPSTSKKAPWRRQPTK